MPGRPRAASGRFPRGKAYLADQLERAATSIVLNFAEGYNEFSPAEKRRFYRMSLRSAGECGAVLDVALRLQLIAPSTHAAAKESLARIAAMLTAFIKHIKD